MSCGIGCRHSLDPALLWPWCSLAATAPIRPLAWEIPYAAGTALKKKKERKKERKKTHIHKKRLNTVKLLEEDTGRTLKEGAAISFWIHLLE